MRWNHFAAGILLLVLVAFTSPCSGGGEITLVNRNSSLDINVTSADTGLVNWTVDGVNSLNFQGLFYRVGSGAESSLLGISSNPTVSVTQIPNALSFLDVTYANSLFSVRTVYQLIGSTAGSGKSGLSQSVTVKNLSASPLDFHLFQYSDFDLMGVTGGQTAQFSFDGANQSYQVTQTDGMRTLTATVNASTAPVGHFDAAPFNTTLSSLLDASATTLGDAASASGNVTFSFQWDAILAAHGEAGDSLVISQLISLVPEPTSGSLLLVGVMALLTRRRKTI
ncbi:MAG: PEP-CTERM sorting domain-containing protein [Verrucomicrobiae bacterium]|nr:PEP-CTERM sorting domain-containing protein [Verrucomicrobiae bacterium]